MTCTDRVAVVGPGRMGVGIALAFACAGVEVDLIDLKRREEPKSSLERANGEFAAQLDRLVSLSVLPEPVRDAVLRRLALHPAGAAAARALARAAYVVEAVPEIAEVKKEALAHICESISANALLASTTSSFLVDTLATFVTQPERFLNTHWLNPAHLMPLVEVSPGQATSDETHAAMVGLLRTVGKVPVTVAATPGYIVPRLQALVMNEAARMLEEGVATADDIDTATRLGFGLRFAVLGSVEFIDWGGVDTLLYASRYLSTALASERFEPPALVTDSVARGATGISAGKGLREFSTADLQGLQDERTGELVALLRHLGRLPGSTNRVVSASTAPR